MWPRDAQSSLWEQSSVTAPAKELITGYVLKFILFSLHALSQILYAEYQNINCHTHKTMLLCKSHGRTLNIEIMDIVFHLKVAQKMKPTSEDI